MENVAPEEPSAVNQGVVAIPRQEGQEKGEGDFGTSGGAERMALMKLPSSSYDERKEAHGDSAFG